MLNLARFSHLALIVAAIGGLWWQAPSAGELSGNAILGAGIIMTLVLYGPLIVMLPATFKGDGRLLTWLCILLLFYFTAFSVQLLDPPPLRYLAMARAGLTVVLFVSALLVIRQRGSRRD